MKKLSVIYRALLLAQVLVAGVAIFVKARGGGIANVDEQTGRALQVAAIVFAFAAVWGGMHSYRKKINTLKNSTAAASAKMGAYMQASLLKWAATEAPCFFTIICYLLTGNMAFMFFAGLLLFVFAGYAPQKSRVMNELSVSEAEYAELQ